MLLDETLANIEAGVAALKNTNPAYDLEPAVIASPLWFLEAVAHAHADKAEEPTDLVDQIHNCKVIQNEAYQEPVLVAGDGRLYPVLPVWARNKPEFYRADAEAPGAGGHLMRQHGWSSATTPAPAGSTTEG